jgi:hypothetical protein
MIRGTEDSRDGDSYHAVAFYNGNKPAKGLCPSEREWLAGVSLPLVYERHFLSPAGAISTATHLSIITTYLSVT